MFELVSLIWIITRCYHYIFGKCVFIISVKYLAEYFNWRLTLFDISWCEYNCDKRINQNKITNFFRTCNCCRNRSIHFLLYWSKLLNCCNSKQYNKSIAILRYNKHAMKIYSCYLARVILSLLHARYIMPLLHFNGHQNMFAELC